MGNISLCAIDTAKVWFQIECRNHANNVVCRKKLRREQLIEFVATALPRGCLVAMEACGGSNYWGQQFRKLGMIVKLIPPQYVKPFRLGLKDDRNDATAIANAVVAPQMRFVPVKEPWQQELQAIIRIRQQLVEQRTQGVNQLRGLLTEYGIVAPTGRLKFCKMLPRLLEENEERLGQVLTAAFKTYQNNLFLIDQQIVESERQLEEMAKSNPYARALIKKLCGVGKLAALSLVAAVGAGTDFKNGRNLAAAIGIVPRHSGTGGKTILGPITKTGNCYVRQLFVHGARSFIWHAENKQDEISLWVKKLLAGGKHKNVAAVALANKLLRMCLPILRQVHREGGLQPV
jgi:transposase